MLTFVLIFLYWKWIYIFFFVTSLLIIISGKPHFYWLMNSCDLPTAVCRFCQKCTKIINMCFLNTVFSSVPQMTLFVVDNVWMWFPTKGFIQQSQVIKKRKKEKKRHLCNCEGQTAILGLMLCTSKNQLHLIKINSTVSDIAVFSWSTKMHN